MSDDNFKIDLLIEEVKKRNNFEKCKVSEKGSNEKGDGYMGIVKVIEVEATTKEGEVEVLQLVAKCALDNEKLRQQMPIRKIYLAEIMAYEDVFPAFEELQTEFKVKGLQKPAKCFGTVSQENCEGLALQNLREIGYSMWNRKVAMDEAHVTMVMEEYGKLHGLSYVMKSLRPELFQKFVDRLDIEALKEFFEYNIEVFMKEWDSAKRVFRKEETEALEKWDELRGEVEEFLHEMIGKNDRCSVLLHGDCWCNNMMFKYEDEVDKKKPTGMTFLDFQIMRLGNPLEDLTYFFYSCSGDSIIKNHEHFVKVYHESLSKLLRDFGLNSEDFYPFSKLQKQWKTYSKYGLLMAFMAIRVMLSEKEEAPDVAKVAEEGGKVMDAFSFNLGVEDEYLLRIRNLVDHFLENNSSD